MALNGNLLLICLGGTAIAGARSAEIISSCGTIEVASATQQTFKKFIADRQEWSVNIGYLVSALTQVPTDLLSVRTEYTLTVTNREGVVLSTSKAICTEAKVTATRGSLITGSFNFKGSNALEEPTT